MKMSLDLMEFILEIICPKKNGAYVINLDEYVYVGTYWMIRHIIYFDSFDSLEYKQTIQQCVDTYIVLDS